jgi:hypothetical protein
MQFSLLLPCCFAVLGALPALVLSSSISGLDLSSEASSSQPRGIMESLSQELLDIIAAYGPNSSLAIRDTGLLQAVEKNASSLDAIGTQSVGNLVSQMTLTGLACQASQLVFGARVIMPKDALYKEEQQENW